MQLKNYGNVDLGEVPSINIRVYQANELRRENFFKIDFSPLEISVPAVCL